MLSTKFKFMSWNVRGLANDDKCANVRSVIRGSRSDVCVLQETKCNRIDFFFC